MEIKKLDAKIFYIALLVFFGLVFIVAPFLILMDLPFHSPLIDSLQIMKYRGRVQKEYGLTIREIKIHWPEYDREVTCFAVASVKPGGKAEKLGFKVGDIFLRKVNTHGCFPEEGQIYWGFADSDSMPGFSWSVINVNDISKDYKERIREVELKER